MELHHLVRFHVRRDSDRTALDIGAYNVADEEVASVVTLLRIAHDDAKKQRVPKQRLVLRRQRLEKRFEHP